MPGNCDIEIEFDELSNDYYIIWGLPVAIGSGSNRIEALDDLRKVAHFCIDSLINLKLEEISKEG